MGITFFKVNGKNYTGVKSFSATLGKDAASNSFSFVTPNIQPHEETGGFFAPVVGDEVEVYYGLTSQSAEYLVGGRVKKTTVRETTIDISGESKSRQLYKGAHKGNVFWEKKSGKDILDEVISPFGIDWTSDIELGEIDELKVRTTDSAFHIIKMVAERFGLTAYTNSLGNFHLSDGVKSGDYYDITQAMSKETTVENDDEFLASEITIKGQSQKNNDYQIEKTIINEEVPFYCPMVFHYKGDAGDQGAFDRFTQYARQRMYGRVATASVKVVSFLSPNGKLWAIDDRVWFVAPSYRVDGAEMVNGIEFRLTLLDENSKRSL